MIEEGASEEMDKSSKIQGTEEGGSLEKGPEDIFKVEVEKPTCETERKHLLKCNDWFSLLLQHKVFSKEKNFIKFCEICIHSLRSQFLSLSLIFFFKLFRS